MTSLRAQGLRLLLSVGLAFALWMFISFTQNPDQRSSFNDVPVEIEGLAPNLVVVDQEGLPRTNRPTVDITAEGDERTVLTVQRSELRAFVDLTERGPGEYNNVPVNVVPNRSGLARLSFSANPAFLSFRLEQEITRTVPLTVAVTGNVPFSFEAGQPRLTHQGQSISSVLIRGPQSLAERVSVARVTADIDRLTANYSSSRPVEAVAQDGQVVAGVTIAPVSINVLVPIGSSAGIKRVPVVPRLVGSPASGRIVGSISVDPQFVRLTGGSGSLDNVQNIETINVDIAGAGQTFTRTVALSVPANTSLAAGEPTMATVRVEIQRIAQPFQITLPASVQATDIPDGLLVSLSPQTVPIALSGNASDLGQVEQAALQGTVSLRGLGEGTYSLTPSFQLPRGVALSSPPPKVTVTLRRPPTATPVPEPTSTPTPAATAAPAPIETPAANSAPTITPAEPAPAATPPAVTPADTPTP
jgi:YbbR domain-containing protein